MNAQLIYFSPTGTSRKIVEAVAEGLAAERLDSFDLTRLPGTLDRTFNDGVVIIGIPVYAGRVPELCLQRMAGIKADGVPAVLIALYGNREYEDALVELRDVVTAAGFNVVAAGAFIGEHSYSTEQQPLAAGRPDRNDLQQAVDLGRQVAAKLVRPVELVVPQIPGNLPYRDRVPLGGIAPETDPGKCTLCGTCGKVCPTFVIEVGAEVTTRAADCVMCCACVKDCPEGARSLIHPVIEERRALLAEVCRKRRREPELFI